MKLIGVAGYARAGKDEVGKALARRGYTVTRFSQVLKDEVLARMPRTVDAIAKLIGEQETMSPLSPWSTFPGGNQEQFRRWLVEERKPIGIRELLQEYGTEVRRADNPEYWVERWTEQANQRLSRGEKLAVVDVRFENEARAVRALSGTILRVMRPGVGPQSSHPSEAQDFLADVVISNAGTLADLDDAIGRLLDSTK